MEILIKSWQEAESDAYGVRQEVFVNEQGVPADLELDALDALATHALVYRDTQCIGTGRLVDLDYKQAQIGRMAVLAQYRGMGIGKRILKKLIDLAYSKGVEKVILHSQVNAIPFYEKLGFEAQGDVYEEAGIPHRNMILLLPNPVNANDY